MRKVMETVDQITDVHVGVEPFLMHDQTQQQIQSKMKTALVLFEYLQGELSIGEISEYYKKSIAETLQWLNDLGISSSRSMGKDLDQHGYSNIKEELKERGIAH